MKTVRCAIYTRKSSEEGLEQDFNSLDAQREACAAYILSQASEGWQLIAEQYNDGGISGGTLERPALKRLLDDVAAGKIDSIVIYKIDRLTRSLLDFAKLVEALEKAGTSFVSVTQSFNTTNSMGRLTLNMLLSFAQFEREVTAERIRDKLAASKAKGMWMGGVPPLGYRPNGRSLTIVEEHARIIRDIYLRYRKHGNVRTVAATLMADGINTPLRKSATGRKFGGCTFSRGQIYNILKNPIYAGNIGHRGKISPGNHRAIISQEDWDEVQGQLAGNSNGSKRPRSATQSTLAGLLFDGLGEKMLAAHTTKAGRRYRYYVSKSLHHGEADRKDESRRVAAGEIEIAVAAELAMIFDDPLDLAGRAGLQIEPAQLMPVVKKCKELAQQLRGDQGLRDNSHFLERVELHDARLEVQVSIKELAKYLGLSPGLIAVPPLILQRPLTQLRAGRAVRLIYSNGKLAAGSTVSPALVELVERAHRWWQRLREGKIGPTELAKEVGYSASYVSRVARVALLAPKVIEAILAGQHKANVSTALLLQHGAIPDCWDEQVRKFVAA